MDRWPRRPPPGERCDAHVGTGEDGAGKPVVYRCLNPATETVRLVGFAFEGWLCGDCATVGEESGWCRRNPKRRTGRSTT